MKFQLLGPWPGPGGAFYEIGTLIDGEAPEWRGVVMPLNAKALDQAAYDALVAWHFPHNDQILRHLQHGPGVIPAVATGDGRMPSRRDQSQSKEQS